MDSKEQKRFEMFARVRDFGAVRRGDFPVGSLGAELFAIVEDVARELSSAAGDRSRKKADLRRKYGSKSEAREALRDHLSTLSRTARVMANRMPGVEDDFRVPKMPNDVMLIATARAFLAAAEPLAATFQRYELPSDFLDRLRADIEGFEDAVRDRNLAADGSLQAGAVIDDGVARGMNAVRELDVIVRNRYRDDAATLEAWTRASHIGRPAVKTAAAASESAAPTGV